MFQYCTLSVSIPNRDLWDLEEVRRHSSLEGKPFQSLIGICEIWKLLFQRLFTPPYTVSIPNRDLWDLEAITFRNITNIFQFQSLIGICEIWKSMSWRSQATENLFQSLIGICEIWKQFLNKSRDESILFQSLIGICEIWKLLCCTCHSPSWLVSIPNRDLWDLEVDHSLLVSFYFGRFQSLIGICEIWKLEAQASSLSSKGFNP